MNMSSSIVGATIIGHLEASTVAVRKLSLIPLTILAIELAVAGAITKTSAHIPL